MWKQVADLIFSNMIYSTVLYNTMFCSPQKTQMSNWYGWSPVRWDIVFLCCFKLGSYTHTGMQTFTGPESCLQRAIKLSRSRNMNCTMGRFKTIHHYEHWTTVHWQWETPHQREVSAAQRNTWKCKCTPVMVQNKHARCFFFFAVLALQHCANYMEYKKEDIPLKRKHLNRFSQQKELMDTSKCFLDLVFSFLLLRFFSSK